MNREDRWIGVLGVICLILVVFAITFIMILPNLTLSSDKNHFFSGTEYKTYQKIKVNLELKDYQRAQDILAEYLTDYPNGKQKNKVLLLATALFYQKKDYEGARQYLDRVIQDKMAVMEDQMDAVILLGKITKDLEMTDPSALSYLENSYIKAPDGKKGEIAAYIGYLYLYAKDYPYAMKYFNLSTGDYRIIGQARVYIEQGDYPKAIQEYLNYFNTYAKNTRYDNIKEAFIKQSLFYADQLRLAKEDQKAIQYYNNISELFPKENGADEALTAIADIYLTRGDYSNALSFYTLAANNAPVYRDDIALYQRAGIFYQMNRKKDALLGFKELKLKFPNSPYSIKSDEWIELLTKEIK